MTRVQYSFEDLADGAAVPTGGGAFHTASGINATSSVLAEADAALDGTMGARVSIGANSELAYLEKTGLNAAALSFAVRFKQPAAPPSGQRRIYSFLNVGGTQIVRLDHNSDGRLLVRGSNSVTINDASGSTAAPAGTVIHWQGYIDPATSELVSVITREDTSAVLNPSTAVLTGQSLSTGNVDGHRVGQMLTTNSIAGWSMDFDSVAFEDAPTRGQLIDAYVAPAATPVLYYSADGVTSVPVELYYSADGVTSVRVDLA